MLFVNTYSLFWYNSFIDIYNTRRYQMKPLKEKISITIDGDVLEKLRILAENDDRSLSQYINIILKDHVKSFEKQ